MNRMTTTKITLPGIGSILVDTERGTLQPSTHVVGQRLGVGYSADTTEEQGRQRARRDLAASRASLAVDGREDGWRWLDHNGHDV
jgi:hypothetical protein